VLAEVLEPRFELFSQNTNFSYFLTALKDTDLAFSSKIGKCTVFCFDTSTFQRKLFWARGSNTFELRAACCPWTVLCRPLLLVSFDKWMCGGWAHGAVHVDVAHFVAVRLTTPRDKVTCAHRRCSYTAMNYAEVCPLLVAPCPAWRCKVLSVQYDSRKSGYSAVGQFTGWPSWWDSNSAQSSTGSFLIHYNL
jgi:hypothetical protein